MKFIPDISEPSMIRIVIQPIVEQTVFNSNLKIETTLEKFNTECEIKYF